MVTKATPTAAEIAKRQADIDLIQFKNGTQSIVPNQWTADLYAATKELLTWGVSPENGKWEINEYGSLTDAIGGTCPFPSDYQPAPAAPTAFSLNGLFNVAAPGVDILDTDQQAAGPAPEPTFPPPPAPPSAPSPFGNKKGRR